LPVSEAVSLQRATPDMAPLLQNLLQLYVHDMSEFFPVEIGSDGLFEYDKLTRYWDDPAERHAFVIRRGTRVAGFVLATRGSPASDTPTDLDVAEFFVLRAHRHSGVGRDASFVLWDNLPGRWVVRVSEANRAAVRYWSEVIGSYTSGVFGESTRPGGPAGWRIFTFVSRAPRPAL
jgi:predicted acetyltransferase